MDRLFSVKLAQASGRRPFFAFLLLSLAPGALACVCGEDGSIVGPGDDGHGPAGGGSASWGTPVGGGASAAPPFDAGAGGGPAERGPTDGGTTNWASAGGGAAGGVDAGAGDAGSPESSDSGSRSTCDLLGDGGCHCLRLATLGFPGQYRPGDVFADWLSQLAPGGVAGLGGVTLSREVLAQYQVIVVEDVREGIPGKSGVGFGIGRSYSAQEITALRGWVMDGGGLVTLTGYGNTTELTNVNNLLTPFGLSYGAVNFSFSPVTHWASHPISAGITQIPYSVGYAVEGTGALLAWEPNPGQSDVARVTELGRGRVFAWGDEWIAFPETLARSDMQVARLWVNLLGWLVQSDQCRVVVPPG